MRRIMARGFLALLMGLTLVGGLASCGPSAEERQKAEAAAARDTEWAALQQVDRELDQKREELAGLRTRLTGAEGEGAEASRAEIQPRLDALQAEVDAATGGFNERLVNFINNNPPVVGEPLTDQQQGAIRMKSDEDIVLAGEYIDQGGDYRKAIKIYQDALQADPGYEGLKRALAAAEQMRFMTAERFALAKKGMGPDEVRAVLGAVNLRNVREHPEQKATAWYYPKDDRGSAAVVWFRKDRSGEEVVYQLDYDAVTAQTGG
jgi:hypothetical protein